MSPRRAGGLLARDAMIRRLAPSFMRAHCIPRAVALEVLASITEEQRYFLFQLQAKAIQTFARKVHT